MLSTALYISLFRFLRFRLPPAAPQPTTSALIVTMGWIGANDLVRQGQQHTRNASTSGTSLPTTRTEHSLVFLVRFSFSFQDLLFLSIVVIYYTVRTEIIEHGARTSKIPPSGLGGKTPREELTLSPHLRHRPY